MPRLPYKFDASPELLESIRARRGGEPHNLDRILLHSPAFASGWNLMMGKLRGDLELTPLLREIAICAVAVLNRSTYQLQHHAPMLRAAGGSDAQLTCLLALPDDSACGAVFDATQNAAVALALQMTRDVAVSDEVFNAARRQLPNDRVMLELVGIIAAHNMVSRILVAFDVGMET